MQCPICRKDYPEHTLQDHHIHPLQYNGPEDGLQTKLCANCHTRVHHQAENLTATTAPRRYYFNPLELERARPYIQAIIKAKILARDQVNTNARNLVTFKLDPKRRTLLHRLKNKSGHRSIDSYLTALIDREIRRLGGY